MNVIRATLNKKSSRGRRGRFKNAPIFHTYFQSAGGEQSKSFMSSSDISSNQPLRTNQGQVLGTADRNSSGSRSSEQVFRTPSVSMVFKNRPANSDSQIINELVVECLNTPDVPPTSNSSNSKISNQQRDILRSIPLPNSGAGGRKPRSSTSSGARPRSTPSHSTSGTPKTPRTPKTTSSLESAQNMIIAITEGRGLARGEVGMAAMDTHRPHLVLCQVSDTQTYASTLTKINVLHPTEILLPNTFIEIQEKNKLFTLIHETFPQVSITTVQRCHFSDSAGLQHVQSLCLTECANVEMVVRQKFYSLSAAAALLKYIEFQKNIIFMPKSLRIEYQCPENVMSIDVKTAQKLELVMSLNNRGTEGSLLGVMDHCCTVGGRRSLRANILQPPTNLDIINSRLLSVTELAQNPALLHSIQSAVSKFCDAEQLLWLCMQVPNFKEEQRASEIQTNFVLLLKTSLDSLPVLRESLQSAQTPYFRKVLKDLDNEKFGLMMSTILEVVNDDAKTKKGFAASTFQRCFAIRTGVNGLLDLARASYSDLVAKLHARVGEMADEYGLALRTCSTSNKGFHIQLSVKRNDKFSAKDLPGVFIQVARTRNLITMTTEELVVLNHRIKQIMLEIQILSNVIMQELLRKLRTHISCLYCLCENISELDLIISFAQVSSSDDFVPPSFGSKMDVKNSRHPILDVISSTTPVANDIFASPEKNFHIITGPNMGGKSIYIKQVALLQVMAQMGCFVPAESAEFRITKQIFSRIGFDDSIEYNASSFVMEMQEMQYILRSMGPECLVVIDELCRSTDSEEGTAVAWVLCEQLLQSKAFVFFTTHYLTLTKLQSLYPNVTNHQMVAESGRSGRLIYTHKLTAGVTKVAQYGLKLAQLSALPTSVLQRAQELCSDLAADRMEEPVYNEEKTEAEEDQEYIQELISLVESNRFNVFELSKIQTKLKKRYGIADSEENIEPIDRNLGEDIETNSDGGEIVANHEVENVPEEPKTPEPRMSSPEGIMPDKDGSSFNRSQGLTQRNSPLLKSCDPPHLRTPNWNTPGNLSHVQNSHIQNEGSLMINFLGPSQSANVCNIQNFGSKVPQSSSQQSENFSRKGVSEQNLEVDVRYSLGIQSPHSVMRSNSRTENTPVKSQNCIYQGQSAGIHPCKVFGSESSLCNREDECPSFVNPILRSSQSVITSKNHSSEMQSNSMELLQSEKHPLKLHNSKLSPLDLSPVMISNSMQTQNYSTPLRLSNSMFPPPNFSSPMTSTSVHRLSRSPRSEQHPQNYSHTRLSNSEQPPQNYSLFLPNRPVLDSKFRFPQPVFTSSSQTKTLSAQISCEASAFENPEVLSPVLDENRGFQSWPATQQRTNCEQRTPSHYIPRSHFSEDIFQSPRPPSYLRAASTPGRLSERISQPSPLSTRSNPSMVLSLFPSFDVVPRNINSGNFDLSDDDDCFEE